MTACRFVFWRFCGNKSEAIIGWAGGGEKNTMTALGKCRGLRPLFGRVILVISPGLQTLTPINFCDSKPDDAPLPLQAWYLHVETGQGLCVPSIGQLVSSNLPKSIKSLISPITGSRQHLTLTPADQLTLIPLSTLARPLESYYDKRFGRSQKPESIAGELLTHRTTHLRLVPAITCVCYTCFGILSLLVTGYWLPASISKNFIILLASNHFLLKAQSCR